MECCLKAAVMKKTGPKIDGQKKNEEPIHSSSERLFGQKTSSLDHLVGKCQQGWWNCKSLRLCGPEIDNEFELGRLDYRHVGGLGPERLGSASSDGAPSGPPFFASSRSSRGVWRHIPLESWPWLSLP